MEGAEDNDYKLLNPKSKLAMYIKSALAIIAMAAAVAVLFVFRTDLEIDVIFCYIAMGCAVAVSVILLIWPQIFYRHYRYIVDTEKVDVRWGVIVIKRTVVPIERVHQVEVVRGPISNYLGLANVVVTTAGGSASIRYLDFDVAESIAEYLKDTVNKIIRDRETE